MNMPAATNMDYNAETNSDVPPTYSRKVLAKDSEWMTAEFTFTTAESVSGNENLILALSAGAASINGNGWTQTDVNQYVGVYFDDITVVGVGNNTQAGEYVYDFVDKGVSCYEGAHHYWFSNSDNDVYNEGKYASYIAEEGMYLTTAVPGTMSGNAQWIHRAAIRDTDINLGGDRGFFKVEAGTKYTVLMKYKTINIESTQARIGIGLSAPGGYAYDVLELGKTQHMVIGLERATHTNVTDEWQYISVEIDGDGTSPCGSTNAGAYVYICATSDGYVPSTFLIESVKVCAVNKGSDSVIITKNVRGKTFDCSIMTAGTELSAPPKSLGETSLGWFLRDGTQVTKAPAVSTTIIAKYPTQVHTFDNGMDDIYMPQATNLGLKLNVVPDPLGDSSNKVLEMRCTQKGGSTNNFVLSAFPGIVSEGFKVKAGSTYSVSFDVYFASNNIKDGGYNGVTGLWLTGKGGISHTGDKDRSSTDVSQQSQAWINETTDSGEWVSISMVYTPNSSKVATYPYLAISFKYGDRKDSTLDNAVVYFDNIVIAEMGESNTNCGVVVLDAFDMKLDKVCYLLNRGDTMQLPTLKKTGYVFIGWTQDKSYALGTHSNTNQNMNDKVSPKTTVVALGAAVYYPIWVAKKTEFTFGTPTETTFQNKLTTTEVTSSTGYVSVGYSLYDEDGDGQYELKADQTPRDPSSYKVNLGTYDGSTNNFYRVREGVTYKITMKFKVAKLQDETSVIGFGRCVVNGFGIVKVTGDDKYSFDKFYTTKSLTDGYIEVSKEYTCKGVFDVSLNGARGNSGQPTTLKDALFVTVNSGCVYIKSIVVEAVSYSKELVKISGDGKLKVNYGKHTITAVPNEGYILKPDSIKMQYKYRFFDVATYGPYDYNNPEHIEYIETLPQYSLGIFNLTKNVYGNETYSFENKFGVCPDGIVISAEFVPIEQCAVGTVASSIRFETAGDNYVSAGLRFRGRVHNDSRITEVGFIVVPTHLMHSLDTLTFNTDGSVNCANALTVVAYGEGKNIVYDRVAEYTDYQVMIKGLTNSSKTIDLTGVEFSVVTYVKYDDDGTEKYSYSSVKTESWQSAHEKYPKI